MTITTEAIKIDGTILPEHTCDGANISPPLTFSEVPAEAASLALTLTDPDAPNGTFTHWLLYDLSPATMQIPQNDMPMTGKTGTNDFGKKGYGGPCPPSGKHRYIFKLFALNAAPNLPEGASITELEKAMEGHITDTAELMGTYEKVA